MTDTTEDTITVTVNGTEIEARAGELLIDACERHGVYIPRFCYHPRMTPVGMCRMCIVEVDTGRGPALQPSCMLTVGDGMIVDTQGEVTTKAQDGVLEFLLINHPLDCPVCDKGGECPLQDQTMAYGPGESRFVEEKRHFEKPIPISETVQLDRERCILCDRCTRFADEVAGDPLIHFMDRGNETQVNTFPDHPFASYFSGNTVQICPVGALTASPYRFKARPWDLEESESTCQSCSVGCRVVIQSSRNEVLRYQGVDVDPVNWGWLCDKGRFDFQSVNSDQRLDTPLVRDGDALTEATWGASLRAATTAIKDGIDRSGPGGVAVIGGSRLTNEDAYAWAKLAKGVIGTDHVDAQLGDGLPAETVLGLPRATIDDACRPGGTVLLIGPDPKEELPVLFLRLRHAVVNDGVRLVQVVPGAGATTDLAAATVTYRPGEVADVTRSLLGGDTAGAEAVEAAEILGGDGPLTVVLGRANLAESAELICAAAGAVLEAAPQARFLSALRRANVHGALDAGLAPGMLPGRVSLDDGRQWFHEQWPTVPAERGLDTLGILAAAADGKIDTLIVLGADPLTDVPDRDLATRGVAGARTVIAVDTFVNATGRQADVVLPAAGYAECDGSTTNLEGRVSPVSQQVTPPGTARADWMIAAELAHQLGADLGIDSVDAAWAELERVSAAHAGITRAMLLSPLFGDGIVAPHEHAVTINGAALDAVDEAHTEAMAADDNPAVADADAEPAAEDESAEEATEAEPTAEPSPRPPLVRFVAPAVAAPAVDAYSLRLVATRRLYDNGTHVAHSPSIANLSDDTELRLHPHDFDRIGVIDGGEVSVSSARATGIRVVCRSDARVPRGAAHVFFNHDGVDAAALIDSTAPVTEIRIESGVPQ